ncbi:restriction endonuclease subunit S [Escherichia coli]|uniref:restriction endonuclease subunit S n=1 Tax=Enterobacteriaceae TaxID=543 RepID=UPI000B953097|nr:MULTISPECIES: restriction endonuclease subunit S [Enterobacteriaceae]EEV5934323.1 restriction endonuclease subunit S [Escherichia coli]EFN5269117.1 restriction endonuclease subunit S [Escherichia coli]EFO1396814.1 restriction endonuclease subunit S [Escherichia coli]EHY5971880.1 restriction endonuclease subunit S [Escherichia coli]EIM2910987.1 restriction endonuclease subunit S [Escherichia coli]
MSFKTYALEDVLEITSSKRIKMADYVQSGIPFYRSKEIIEKSNNQPVSTDIFITCEHFDKIKMKFGAPEAGDILLTSVGTLGVSYQVSDDDLFYFKDGNLTWFRNFNNRVLSGYIYCWLKSPSARKKLDEISIGTTQRALTIASLKKILIKIPSLDVQKKIVFIYESLSKKIINNGKINQTLEQMAQVLFKSWFVDFEPVKAKMAVLEAGGSQEDATLAAMTAISGKDADALVVFEREQPEQYAELKATAELFPSAMQESELGEIPEGWELSSLSEKIKLIGGGTPKRSEPEFWNGDICWYSVKDAPADSDVFVIDTTEKITKKGLDKSSAKLLPIGTTIISARGTVGKLALTATEMAMNQSCYGISGGEFSGPLLTYLKVKQCVDVLKRNTHGAVFDTITTSTFDTVVTLTASKIVNHRFEKIVTPLFNDIENNLRTNASLTQLRDTLLPKLLSGEITLPEAEQAVSEAENV